MAPSLSLTVFGWMFSRHHHPGHCQCRTFKLGKDHRLIALLEEEQSNSPSLKCLHHTNQTRTKFQHLDESSEPCCLHPTQHLAESSRPCRLYPTCKPCKLLHMAHTGACVFACTWSSWSHCKQYLVNVAGHRLLAEPWLQHPPVGDTYAGILHVLPCALTQHDVEGLRVPSHNDLKGVEGWDVRGEELKGVSEQKNSHLHQYWGIDTVCGAGVQWRGGGGRGK